jgi:hypothetical protein
LHRRRFAGEDGDAQGRIAGGVPRRFPVAARFAFKRPIVAGAATVAGEAAGDRGNPMAGAACGTGGARDSL